MTLPDRIVPLNQLNKDDSMTTVWRRKTHEREQNQTWTHATSGQPHRQLIPCVQTAGREKRCMTAPVDPQLPLRQFAKSNDFFIGIDSDGCVFDTMEVKHKECFIPNIIKFYHLAAISKYAREVFEF